MALKIDCGCGSKVKRGFVGCDVRKQPGVKFVCDAWEIANHVELNSVDELYSRHMFEHLSFVNGKRTMSAWFDVLKPGGKLEVSMPDMHFHAVQYLEYYHNRKQKSRLGKGTEFGHALASLFGWQRQANKQTWDIHKSGYDQLSLEALCNAVGFERFERTSDKVWNLRAVAYKPTAL